MYVFVNNVKNDKCVSPPQWWTRRGSHLAGCWTSSSRGWATGRNVGPSSPWPTTRTRGCRTGPSTPSTVPPGSPSAAHR